MSAIIILLFALFCIEEDNPGMLFDAGSKNSVSDWFVVDDGVMGGLSKGAIKRNENGNLQYSGYVSTDNNGGFSSIRYRFDSRDVSKFSSVALRVKGDGKAYQFRIKANAGQRYSYISTFKTSGEWETIRIPLNRFYPGFRGYRLNRPNYSGELMEEIAFLIGNKVDERFKLEIKSIALIP